MSPAQRHKAVQRETLDLIVQNIQDAHAATNALFAEKLDGVRNRLVSMEASFGARVTELEDDHKKVSRKVYMILGGFAVIDLVIGVLLLVGHR